jgi:hypothetical protein
VTEARPWLAAEVVEVAGAVSEAVAVVGEPVAGDAGLLPAAVWWAEEEPEPAEPATWVAPVAEPPAAPAEPALVEPPTEPPVPEPPPADPEPDPELVCPDPETGVVAWDVVAVTAWLAAEVTGAAAWVTVEAACETVADACPTAELTVVLAAEVAEPPVDEVAAEAVVEAGLVAPETTWLTGPVTPLTTPVTVLVTEPSRPPLEPELEPGDDAGAEAAARPVVAAWALDPDRSQNKVISPKQQPANTRPRAAIRLAPLWPADPHASGTAYSTPA